MPRNANGRRIYALADYTVERRGKGWYFGRTSRFGDAHAMNGPYSSERSGKPIVECVQGPVSGRSCPPWQNRGPPRTPATCCGS